MQAKRGRPILERPHRPKKEIHEDELIGNESIGGLTVAAVTALISVFPQFRNMSENENINLHEALEKEIKDFLRRNHRRLLIAQIR